MKPHIPLLICSWSSGGSDVLLSRDAVPSRLGLHQLKWIPWKKDLVPIVTQNENDPCPLLSLCNVLICYRYHLVSYCSSWELV